MACAKNQAPKPSNGKKRSVSKSAIEAWSSLISTYRQKEKGRSERKDEACKCTDIPEKEIPPALNIKDNCLFFNAAHAVAPFPISKNEENSALKISFENILCTYPQSTVKKDTIAQIYRILCEAFFIHSIIENSFM